MILSKLNIYHGYGQDYHSQDLYNPYCQVVNSGNSVPLLPSSLLPSYTYIEIQYQNTNYTILNSTPYAKKALKSSKANHAPPL